MARTAKQIAAQRKAAIASARKRKGKGKKKKKGTAATRKVYQESLKNWNEIKRKHKGRKLFSVGR